jgi:hypothetical protein
MFNKITTKYLCNKFTYQVIISGTDNRPGDSETKAAI